MKRTTERRGLERALVRKASVLTSAATLGTLRRMGVPVAIAGFPWKLGVSTLALLGEGMSKGNVQAVMGGIADASMAIYVERSIGNKVLVAGEGDYDEDDGGEV